MNDQKLKNLLNKYLSGKASKAEMFIVESWLESFQQDKEDETVFQSAADQDLLADQILAKAFQNETAVVNKPGKTVSLWKAVVGIAALLAVVISVSVVYFRTPTEIAPVLSKNFDRYETQIREFKQLQLPDSTMVYLNANSTLEVQQDFTKQGERRVKLNGEAFFDVKKDRKHPFKIQVGELQVKVLGTSFNIKAIEATEEITVAVKSGKVNVSVKDSVLSSLTVNQKFTFDKKTQMFEVNDGEESAKALWRNGVVILEKASFAELKASIYDIYGVTLKSDDAGLLARNYNFTIRSSRTLPQTLNQLCEMIKRKHRKEESSVIIF